MLYAVIDAQGEPIAQGLTEAEAGHAILTYDGAQYELRPDADGEGWILWGRSRNGPWTPSIYGSWQTDRDAAEAEILALIARAADTANRWPAEAIPQADFDAMQEGGEG
jgi:hypothetical protein